MRNMPLDVCISTVSVAVSRGYTLVEDEKGELLRLVGYDVNSSRRGYMNDTDIELIPTDTGFVLTTTFIQWFHDAENFITDFKKAFKKFYRNGNVELCKLARGIDNVTISFKVHFDEYDAEDMNSIGVVYGWNTLSRDDTTVFLGDWLPHLIDIELSEYGTQFRVENPDTFGDLWESGETFYQVSVYDRCEDYTTGGHPIYNVATLEDRDALVKHINDTNAHLEEYIDSLLESYSGRYGLDVSRGDLFKRVKDTYGFCHMGLYERNRIREEEEEMEELEDNVGPYGGAFRDEEDYWNWKEGPGFCR